MFPCACASTAGRPPKIAIASATRLVKLRLLFCLRTTATHAYCARMAKTEAASSNPMTPVVSCKSIKRLWKVNYVEQRRARPEGRDVSATRLRPPKSINSTGNAVSVIEFAVQC